MLYGGIQLDHTRTIEDVSSGYTEFQNDDVIVAKITPCFENGKAALASGLLNGAAFGTTELHVLRAESKLDNKFLFYVVVSDRFRKLGESEMHGAGGQKRVPPEFAKNFPMQIPPLSEQRRIAAFLDWKTGQIDGLIAKKQALLGTLKEKRLALITQAVTKGLNLEAPLKDSGIPWLGDIPKHWIATSVRRVIRKIEQGWSPKCFSRPAELEEWGVLKAGCVNRGEFNEDENKALPSELEPIMACEINKGDVLVSRANGSPELVGSTAYVYKTRSRLMLSDKTFRIHLDGKMLPLFFVAVFNSRPMRSQIESAISGADGLANNLPQSTMLTLQCAIPPLDEQTAIIRRLDTETGVIDMLTVKIRSAIARLTEYRTALITAATTGKIDVRNIKIPETSASPSGLEGISRGGAEDAEKEKCFL